MFFVLLCIYVLIKNINYLFEKQLLREWGSKSMIRIELSLVGRIKKSFFGLFFIC